MVTEHLTEEQKLADPKRVYSKIPRLIERARVNKANAAAYVKDVKRQASGGKGGRKGKRFYVYMPLAVMKAMAELDIWLNHDGIRSRSDLMTMFVELYVRRDPDLLAAIEKYVIESGDRIESDKNIRKKYSEAVEIRQKVLGEQSGLSEEDIIDIFDAAEEQLEK